MGRLKPVTRNLSHDEADTIVSIVKKSVGCHCRYDRWKTYFGK